MFLTSECRSLTHALFFALLSFQLMFLGLLITGCAVGKHAKTKQHTKHINFKIILVEYIFFW